MQYPAAKFIWADKVALFAALALLSLLALFWSVAFLAIGSAGAEHLWSMLGLQTVGLGLLVAAFIWIVMRSADFLIGGSTFRLFVEGVRKINSLAAPLLARNAGRVHPVGKRLSGSA